MHFGVRNISGAAQCFDDTWVLAQDGVGLFLYNGLTVSKIDIPHAGSVGKIGVSGATIFLSIYENETGIFKYDINSKEWSQIQLPNNFEGAEVISFANGHFNERLAILFSDESRFGLAILDKKSSRIRSRGWLKEGIIQKCDSLTWFDEGKWIISGGNRYTLINTETTIRIGKKPRPAGNFDKTVNISPGTVALFRHAQDKVTMSLFRILSNQGLGGFSSINGSIGQCHTGVTYLLNTATHSSSLYRLDTNTLLFEQIGPPLSLNRLETFTTFATGNDGSVFASGSERTLIINPWRNLMGTAHRITNAESSGPGGSHVFFTHFGSQYRTEEFPYAKPSKIKSNPLYWDSYPWKYDHEGKLSHYEYPDYEFSYSKRSLNKVIGLMEQTLQFDPIRKRILRFSNKHINRIPSMTVIGKDNAESSKYIEEKNFDFRNIIPTQEGYIDLIGRFNASVRNRYIRLYYLNEKFDLIRNLELQLDKRYIAQTPEFYAHHLLPEIQKLVAGYEDVWGLIGREDFSEFGPGKLVKAFPVHNGSNLLVLNWKGNRFEPKIYQVDGHPSEFFGVNKQGRLVFRGGPYTSIVEFAINNSKIESVFNWQLPNHYNLQSAIVRPGNNSWILIERKGIRGSMFYELKEETKYRPSLSVDVINDRISFGDTFTVNLSVKTPYRLEKPLLPYYFKWKPQNGEWSDRLPIADYPVELEIPNPRSGVQRLEFKLINHFNEDGISTTRSYLNILPIPLQQRDWFRYAVLSIFLVLLLVLIVAIIQSIRSHRGARSLAVLNQDLEDRVLQRTAKIDAQNQELQATNILLEEANEKILDTGKALAEASRKAGMAQVASGVIHNVGNVFNSLTVSLNLLQKDERLNKASQGVKKLHALYNSNKDKREFWEDTKKRTASIDYLGQLCTTISQISDNFKEEFEHVEERLQKVAGIIRSQEKYAKSPTDVKQECSLRELVNESLDIVSMQVPLGDMEVSLKDSLGSDKAMLDVNYARQILSVLIANAYDACIESNNTGPIEIALNAKNAKRGPSISVRDEGIGIRNEDLKHLFAHGFTTKKGGAGSNLHDAVNLARVMGGNIIGESDGHGKGACFYFELPSEALMLESVETVDASA
ncbi:MAG: ATP-binding protein [Verrucomicrobiota bacterium]